MSIPLIAFHPLIIWWVLLGWGRQLNDPLHTICTVFSSSSVPQVNMSSPNITESMLCFFPNALWQHAVVVLWSQSVTQPSPAAFDLYILLFQKGNTDMDVLRCSLYIFYFLFFFVVKYHTTSPQIKPESVGNAVFSLCTVVTDIPLTNKTTLNLGRLVHFKASFLE